MLDSQTLISLRDTAVQAARSAAPKLLERFQQKTVSIERKADGSPVTIADREAEDTIRSLLQANPFPDPIDILGEEYGSKETGAHLRWLIDPIDGTRSFINGIPLFGTIVALENVETRRPELGVIHLPVLNLTYAAARGLGSTCNGKPVRVSPHSTIDRAMVTVGDPAQFTSANREAAYQRLQQLCPYLRGYTDCFGHAMVISGAVGAMLDPDLNPWDIVATQVLIEEAGGRIILRPSATPNKVDALFGSPAMVDFLAQQLSF